MSKEIKQTPSETEAPNLRVLGQYVKDISFENPHAPGVLQKDAEGTNIDMNVNVEAKPHDNIGLEVSLSVKAEAKQGEKTIFITEIVYAGLFQLENIPEDHVQAVILIECPRLLFPFAREVIATVTRQGGFPPLLLDPIDFSALYQAKLEQKSQEEHNTAPQTNPGGITLN